MKGDSIICRIQSTNARCNSRIVQHGQPGFADCRGDLHELDSKVAFAGHRVEPPEHVEPAQVAQLEVAQQLSPQRKWLDPVIVRFPGPDPPVDPGSGEK
jgi:hypothetical protein